MYSIENNGMVAEQPLPIKKHRYPVHVTVCALIAGAIFLIVITDFLWNELSFYKHQNKRIQTADNLFRRQNFLEAVIHYKQLYAEFPLFDEACIRTIKCYLALGTRHHSFYERGLEYLFEYMETNKLSHEEYKKIVVYVPYSYRDHFFSLFTFEMKGK